MRSPASEPPPALVQYLRSFGLHETPEQMRLWEETAQMPNADWASTPEQAALVQQLIRLGGLRRILEVGTFTGCMTLAMALATGRDGRIVTCDAASGWSDLGIHFWRDARVDGMIERRIGRALEVLEGLLREGERSRFDLVFLDADPGNFPAYLDAVTPLLRTGGLLLAARVLGDGLVADPEATDEDTEALRVFNRRLHDEGAFRVAMLSVGGGLTVAIKQ